ncbi:MAG: mRNA surveillance protein pelota [Candidatus Heimdallarchaeota archaeon]|nr:mRNA surveillance protein pelota [Candidatus Heimdallarchaeota archaeon]
MKILKKDYKNGILELIPENIDDLYAIYRILKAGDIVRAATSRRIRKKEDDGRADAGERIKMTLEVEIEELAFHGFGDNLRFKGKILAGPDDLVSLGTYHTISLSLMEKIRIQKLNWTPMEKKVVDDVEEASMLAKILIVTIEDNSVCIALVTQFSIKIISEFSSAVTRKFSDIQQHTSEMGTFFVDVLQLIQDTVKQYSTELIILAGPGFTPENFYEFIKNRDPLLTEKINRVHVSTGGRVGLKEVLSKKLPEKIANEQRVVYETRLVEEIFKRLGQETGTVTYGLERVKRALEMGAIEVLLISDNQISVEDLEKRAMIDSLVDENSRMRGKTVMMSIHHESGEQLASLGGIAALLRYPLHDS